MLFALICTFAPGAFARAKGLRLEHYAFLRTARGVIHEGGPLIGPDGVPVGMLMAIEAEDEEAARQFVDGEPYNRNKLFESVSVRRWRHVIPEPRPGYIEAEYKAEVERREG